MTTEEAVIFKQYDFRQSVTAKATFHQAIDDRLVSSHLQLVVVVIEVLVQVP
jgi:hypothetical protein